MTKKWLDTRRSYLEKLKSQVALITGGDSRVISKYASSNLKLYKEVWSKDSESVFVRRAISKKIVLCGDFHSSPSVKRFYMKLFARIGAKAKEQVTIALECFDVSLNPLFQLWLRGEVGDDELLETGNWDENWGFSWKSYKKFIMHLHHKGFAFKCVNSLEDDFVRRDFEMAKSVRRLSDECQGLVIFLVGQLHLGPDHLPKNLTKLSKELSPLCLHLDPEEIYFELEEYNLLQEVQVLSYQNHFCFLSTPPWVHWQNHLLHLEGLYDDDDDDVDEDFDELRGEEFNAVVADYVDLMKRDLGIEINVKAIDVDFIDEYVTDGETDPKIYEIMQPMLDSETSFYWPEQAEGIMIMGSLNQAASVAGKYLHTVLRNESNLPWGDVDSLNAWCWLEAVGYMMSKLINPKRTASSTANISAFLRARLGSEASKKLMQTLVKGRVLELDQSLNLSHPRSLSWSEVVYAARLKGALVGESLFDLYSAGGLTAETVQTYMSVPVMDKERFEPFYRLVLNRLGLEQQSERELEQKSEEND